MTSDWLTDAEIEALEAMLEDPWAVTVRPETMRRLIAEVRARRATQLPDTIRCPGCGQPYALRAQTVQSELYKWCPDCERWLGVTPSAPERRAR